VCAADRARVREALRAAVGLGLRGDRVRTVLAPSAAAHAADAAVARALATLVELGRPAALPAARADVAGLLRDADAAEVWT
jgi:hypothetical protein